MVDICWYEFQFSSFYVQYTNPSTLYKQRSRGTSIAPMKFSHDEFEEIESSERSEPNLGRYADSLMLVDALKRHEVEVLENMRRLRS